MMAGKLTMQQLLTRCSNTGLPVTAAVDASQFKPDVSRRQPGRLTVVALSRLVYRKGIDLLVVIIPEMCYRHPQVDFIIGIQTKDTRRDMCFGFSLSLVRPSECFACVAAQSACTMEPCASMATQASHLLLDHPFLYQDCQSMHIVQSPGLMCTV